MRGLLADHNVEGHAAYLRRLLDALDLWPLLAAEGLAFATLAGLRIARDTGLPVTLGYVDGRTRTAGLGPTLHPTGDVAADMDRIRAFYADKTGMRPENRTEPRLREENPRV